MTTQRSSPSSSPSRWSLPVILAALTCAPWLHAQWLGQEIRLRPGWNAVFLQVQPEPRATDVVFRDLPVESVWMWNGRFSTVQFIADPEVLVPGDRAWLTWMPPGAPAAAVTNLFTIRGGRAYLVKIGGADDVVWNVVGRPVVRPLEWLADSFNLVGFWVDASNPPPFDRFFAPSREHSDLLVYRLDEPGVDAAAWQTLADPGSGIERGRAYWIHAEGPSTYTGPVAVEFEAARGIHFGRTLLEQSVRFENRSSVARTLLLRRLPSEEPPDPEEPALAGEVPLSYWTFDPAAVETQWKPFPEELRLAVPPGGTSVLRLEVRRRDMVPFVPSSGRPALYQSLLEVTDGMGTRMYLPVTSKGLIPDPEDGAGAGGGVELPPGERFKVGLWVGAATVNAVNQPANTNDPTTPLPTASEFQLRLIVHVDSEGRARLLQQVIQMWQNGAYKPDPLDPTQRIVDQPGRFVLLTRDELIPEYSGAALRDGRPMGRRISSAAFGFRDPVAMEDGGSFGEELDFTMTRDYEDPRSPFKHRYHPDHDNKDERFENALPEGRESFTIERSLTLEFTEDDPDGLDIAGWGDNQLGGIYRETIAGVHRAELHVRGTFRLQRVSRIGVLEGGREE